MIYCFEFLQIKVGNEVSANALKNATKYISQRVVGTIIFES
jgi:hypothetical protein